LLGNAPGGNNKSWSARSGYERRKIRRSTRRRLVQVIRA